VRENACSNWSRRTPSGGSSPTPEAIRWLNDKVFCHVYGEKVGDDVYPSMTKKSFVGFHNKDLDLRTKVAHALPGQLDGEAIEPVREMVQRRAYDPSNSDLMRKLVAFSTALCVAFLAHPVWNREADERLARQERRMQEMRGVLPGPGGR
jgi:hypothetical protein